MSIKLMSLIWDADSTRINGIEKAILVKMADFAADDGTHIFPSIETLSKKLGFSRMTIIKYLKSLITKKLIKKRIRKKPNGLHKSNEYIINVKLLEELKDIELPSNTENTSSKLSTGGVVRHAYRGSTPRVPEPSLDPLLKQNNNKVLGNIPREGAGKLPLPISLSESLVVKLKELGATEKDFADWKFRSEEYIKQKFEMMERKKAKVQKPLGWLRGAIEQDWKDDSNPLPNISQRIDTENRNKLDEMKANEARSALPENRVKGRNTFDGLKPLIRKAIEGVSIPTHRVNI